MTRLTREEAQRNFQGWFDSRPLEVQRAMILYPLGEYSLMGDRVFVVGYNEYESGAVGLIVMKEWGDPRDFPEDSRWNVCGGCLEDLELVKPYVTVRHVSE